MRDPRHAVPVLEKSLNASVLLPIVRWCRYEAVVDIDGPLAVNGELFVGAGMEVVNEVAMTLTAPAAVVGGHLVLPNFFEENGLGEDCACGWRW